MAGASAPAPAAAAPVEVCCYAWYLTPAELRALLCLVFLGRNKHEQGTTKEFSFYHKDRSLLEISSGGRRAGSSSHPDVVYSEVEQIWRGQKGCLQTVVKLTNFILMIQVAIIKEIKNLVEGMNLVQVWNTNFRHSVLFPSKICLPSFKTFAFYTPLSRPRSSLRALQQLWSLTSQRMKLRKYKLLFKL